MTNDAIKAIERWKAAALAAPTSECVQAYRAARAATLKNLRYGDVNPHDDNWMVLPSGYTFPDGTEVVSDFGYLLPQEVVDRYNKAS